MLYQLALRLTYYSLIILGIGLFTSTTLFGLHHLLLLFPILYFTVKNGGKWVSASHLCLLILCGIIILSILVNWDIVLDPRDGLGMGKFYLLSALAIFPYKEAFKTYINFPRKKLLLNLFLLCPTIASLSGLIAIPLGFNFLGWAPNPFPGRASGLVGGILGHSYGISLFLIILSGLLLNFNSFKGYVSKNLLILYWIINFLNLYFSFSRGAWLGYFFAVPFLFWFKSKKTFLVIILLGLSFLGLSLKFSTMAKERFFGEAGLESSDRRISYFKTALLGFLERPILGWGFDNFRNYVIPLKKKYNLKYQEEGGKVHNNFTEFLSTTGIFGLTFFSLFIFYWIKEALQTTFLKETHFSFILSMLISGMVYNTLTEKFHIIFILGVYSVSGSLVYATTKKQNKSAEYSLDFQKGEVPG